MRRISVVLSILIGASLLGAACGGNVSTVKPTATSFEYATQQAMPPSATPEPTLPPTETNTPVPTDTLTPSMTPTPNYDETATAESMQVVQAVDATLTAYPTATNTATLTPSPEPTETNTPTMTVSPTLDRAATAEAFQTQRADFQAALRLTEMAYTAVPSQTPLPTYTDIPSQTPLPTYTDEPSQTPLPTYTNVPTETPLPTSTATPTPNTVLTAQAARTQRAEASDRLELVVEATVAAFTAVPSQTPLPTYTQIPTLTATAVPTRDVLGTAQVYQTQRAELTTDIEATVAAFTAVPSQTPLPTFTNVPSQTPLPTYTQIPTLTATAVPTRDVLGTAQAYQTQRAELTTDIEATVAAFTAVPSQTPLPTFTNVPSQTPQPTYTDIPSQTPLPTYTDVPSQTPLPTYTQLPTNTATATSLPTLTQMATDTHTPTTMPSATMVLSATPDLVSTYEIMLTAAAATQMFQSTQVTEIMTQVVQPTTTMPAPVTISASQLTATQIVAEATATAQAILSPMPTVSPSATRQPSLTPLPTETLAPPTAAITLEPSPVGPTPDLFASATVAALPAPTDVPATKAPPTLSSAQMTATQIINNATATADVEFMVTSMAATEAALVTPTAIILPSYTPTPALATEMPPMEASATAVIEQATATAEIAAAAFPLQFDAPENWTIEYYEPATAYLTDRTAEIFIYAGDAAYFEHEWDIEAGETSLLAATMRVSAKVGGQVIHYDAEKQIAVVQVGDDDSAGTIFVKQIAEGEWALLSVSVSPDDYDAYYTDVFLPLAESLALLGAESDDESTSALPEFESYASDDLGLSFDIPLGWTPVNLMDTEDALSEGMAAILFFANPDDAANPDDDPMAPAIAIIRVSDSSLLMDEMSDLSPVEFLNEMFEGEGSPPVTFDGVEYPAARMVLDVASGNEGITYALQVGPDNWVIVLLAAPEDARLLDEILMGPVIRSIEVTDPLAPAAP